MACCHGCGRYIGEHSAYRRKVPGKSDIVLCYRCHRWADRHAGGAEFPAGTAFPPRRTGRIRTVTSIYILGSLILFVFGIGFLLASAFLGAGFLIILGAASLFLIGFGMRKSLQK